jgi:demethylmenaquinone methyltransferase/2-methoxy-6-polyprenyl-1,4-benzoquinol methylase
MQDQGMSMKNVELPFIKEMFDAIAPRYDFLNRMLSMRQDVMWRRMMVGCLDLAPGSRLLDVACGTGDVLIEAGRQTGDDVILVGADFSPGMLALARGKTAGTPSRRIHLSVGNGLGLPFGPATFDAVTIAFGIRNISNKIKALREFRRCLKPGGVLAVLELTTPPEGRLRELYLLYFKNLLPLVGRLVSGDRSAYNYLPESVLGFPPTPEFLALMRQTGYRDIRYRKLTLGIATLFLGRKSV